MVRVRPAVVSAAVLLWVTLLAVVVGIPGAHATQLAGLKLVPADGPVGSTVKVTGTWFAGPVEEGSPERVELRWGGGPDAPLLGVAHPDAGGTFITTVRVPRDATEGPHVMVATQQVRVGADLAPAPGSPARKAFTVGAPLSGPVGSAVPRAAGPAGVPLAFLAVGLAGMLAAAAGAVLLLRETSGPTARDDTAKSRRSQGST